MQNKKLEYPTFFSLYKCHATLEDKNNNKELMEHYIKKLNNNVLIVLSYLSPHKNELKDKKKHIYERKY